MEGWFEMKKPNSIRVSGIDAEWDPERGTCSFQGLPVIMMWIDTTLTGLMTGVQAMVGTQRFLLSLQSQGRRSVEEDWRVISSFGDFREGFAAIANIAAVAGWGGWTIASIDEERKECRFRVTDSWESRYQKSLGVCWGSGLLAGKMAGYCSKLFGTNCWAEQTSFIARNDPFDEFFVTPSPRSVEKEIEDLLATDEATRADMAIALRKLEREIAERRKSEEALRASERNYRSVIENIQDVFYRSDPEGRLLMGSPSGVAMFGFDSLDEMIGLPFDPVWSDLKERERLIAHIKAEGGVKDFEAVLKRKDGTLFNASFTTHFYYDEHGNFQGTEGIIHDITARTNAVKALRESEEKFRTLVEATSDWIWETDAEGSYTYASPRVRDLLGYGPDEVIGKKPFDFMPPVEAERLRGRFTAITSERRPFFNLVNENIRTDGGTVILETSGVPRLDAQGKFQGYRGIDRDITERTRAEATIRENKAFIQALLDTSRDWIWAIDGDGVHTYSNPAVRIILGYELDEVVGVSSFNLICEEDRKKVDAEIRQCIAQKRGWNRFVVRWRHRDGGYRYLESNSVPILDGEGDVVGFRGVDRDITERKRAEEERLELERRLLHGQKLESMGILAGGIAHDFNNLLMAILGNLDMALMNLSPISPVRESIVQAMQATRRATDLTREMLAYSGKGRFVVVHLNLSELARQNAELFRAAISRKVTFNLSLIPDQTLMEADPGQIQQVIMNLITNASEAIGEEPGVITLTTGVEECGEERLSGSRLEEKPPAGRFAYLEVSDTGSGMDGETQQRLFDPFFTTKFTGRGLGMSAVLGIVRGHRGAIFVKSAAGKGTAIRVLFPVIEREDAAPSVTPAPHQHDAGLEAGSRVVLVVDDEDAVRRLCLGFLTRLGFRGVGASNGEEALKHFETHSKEIAFVLLDLTMPMMDGVTTFRRMKLLDPDVRVMLTSGYSEQEAVQRFEGEGLSGFIQKPYELHELKDKISLLISGRK
jgi:PAS domain S-box-containing protein